LEEKAEEKKGIGIFFWVGEEWFVVLLDGDPSQGDLVNHF
jgi:hypothetical protein